MRQQLLLLRWLRRRAGSMARRGRASRGAVRVLPRRERDHLVAFGEAHPLHSVPDANERFRIVTDADLHDAAALPSPAPAPAPPSEPAREAPHDDGPGTARASVASVSAYAALLRSLGIGAVAGRTGARRTAQPDTMMMVNARKAGVRRPRHPSHGAEASSSDEAGRPVGSRAAPIQSGCTAPAEPDGALGRRINDPVPPPSPPPPRHAAERDGDAGAADDLAATPGGNGEDSDSSSSTSDEDERNASGAGDPIVVHFSREFDSATCDRLCDADTLATRPVEVVDMDDLDGLAGSLKPIADCIAKRLVPHWLQLRPDGGSTLQRAVFARLNAYNDVQITHVTLSNAESLRQVYCIHAMHHVVRTRMRVSRHTAKLQRAAEGGAQAMEIRDQGFLRPIVLLVAPMRNVAFAVVQMLLSLCPQSRVENKQRFLSEYGPDEAAGAVGDGDDDDGDVHKIAAGAMVRPSAPPDHRATFTGNTDDCFRIVLRLTRMSVKLYADLHRSDIVIASPLGLRLLFEAEHGGFDFLSSIEVAIIDGADVLNMQNWDHLVQVFEHTNLLPRAMHDTDFSRVRRSFLDGYAKLYRQTVLLTAFPMPEANALFSHHCYNYAGLVRFCVAAYAGVIVRIVSAVQQLFQRIACASPADDADARFNAFVSKILPLLSGSGRLVAGGHVLVFVPSYFDYVRLRNHLCRKDIAYAGVCEYTTPSRSLRAMRQFRRGERLMLLYTERAHFYHRPYIRGVRHVIFYGLPEHAEFYVELVNAIPRDHAADAMVRILYTQYDRKRLERVVGTSRCKRMLSSGKGTHMFC